MAGHAGVAGRRCRGVGDICVPGGGSQADAGKHHAPHLADRPGDIQHQYGDQRPDRTAGRSDKRRTDAGTCRTGICHRNDPGICAGAADAPVPGRGENRFTLSDYHSGHSDSGHGAHRSGDHRRYRCFPYHYRSDPDILSGGCEYAFRIPGNRTGEEGTDVLLCSQ